MYIISPSLFHSAFPTKTLHAFLVFLACQLTNSDQNIRTKFQGRSQIKNVNKFRSEYFSDRLCPKSLTIAPRIQFNSGVIWRWWWNFGFDKAENFWSAE